MLDIQFIRDNKELAQENAAKKKRPVDIERLLVLDEERRAKLIEVEQLNSLKNDINLLIQKAESSDERAEIIEKGKEIKKQLDTQLPALRLLEEEYFALLYTVPNIATDDTPIGADDTANKILHQVGIKPEFSFVPKEHFELGEELGVIDTRAAAEVSGSRFVYLKGDLVRLQYALVQYIFDVLGSRETLEKIATESNLHVATTPFIPVVPPVFVRPEVLQKMDRLEPRDDRYHLVEDDLYLAGSAEHTLGPLHMGEIIPEQKLPIRYVGYSTAFRRESGTYGKDMKGIIRLHQFDKLEMESFTLPETGLDEQNFLVAIQQHIMQNLRLPYRVMAVCTGDMGKPDARQIDIETWLPGQDQYRETHSADYMTDYQARRLMTRVRRADGNIEYVHMNDGTALAIGRTLVAIMENYQQEDGSILVPNILVPLVGKERITKLCV
jgi:seryl-tRNA synthetase